MSGFLRRHAGKLALALFAVALAPWLAHLTIRRAAELRPPAVVLARAELTHPAPGLRRFGASYAYQREGLLEVGLSGTPAEIGLSHARLLYPEMVENEGILTARFHEQVPNALLRGLLLDLAQVRYREVDQGMRADRRAEIAAEALGFQPDPYADPFPTYQRFVYLNALYDISLSFEHSPLIGCTTFTFGGSAVQGGGSILARAFDFEVDEVFDRGKAVFLVRERGKIPFASVAWPGLVGVVSGMNAEGLALVVHGARAGNPRATGEPVVHALRRVLGTAKNLDEAVRALGEGAPMVSHIVIAVDASGRALAIERVPGMPDYVRVLANRAATTNHFEGPSATDPKNRAVRAGTSTLPRRARADELVAELPLEVGASDAVRLLRDRMGRGGQVLPLGDRRAINALIATHGVVMDSARRTLWVSESPHLLGRFIAFDLARMLAPDYDPAQAAALTSIPADPLLTSGEYARWKAARP
jgi:isopenicillin-N N-acyltransferase like protein